MSVNDRENLDSIRSNAKVNDIRKSNGHLRTNAAEQNRIRLGVVGQAIDLGGDRLQKLFA